LTPLAEVGDAPGTRLARAVARIVEQAPGETI
jgi:FXSXX-COOH protein